LLRQRGLLVTFFINTDYLGARRSYWFSVLSYVCTVTRPTTRFSTGKYGSR
jgi:hypothetical protein